MKNNFEILNDFISYLNYCLKTNYNLKKAAVNFIIDNAFELGTLGGSKPMIEYLDTLNIPLELSEGIEEFKKIIPNLVDGENLQRIESRKIIEKDLSYYHDDSKKIPNCNADYNNMPSAYVLSTYNFKKNNKGERTRQRMRHYKRRLKKYNIPKNEEMFCLKDQGKPCSCYMCSHDKFNRKVKHKKDLYDNE